MGEHARCLRKRLRRAKRLALGRCRLVLGRELLHARLERGRDGLGHVLSSTPLMRFDERRVSGLRELGAAVTRQSAKGLLSGVGGTAYGGMLKTSHGAGR